MDRVPCLKAIAPCESRRFEIHFELPPEPGRYRVFLSGMQEHSHWFYERGAEFLLVDTAVEAGHASIQKSRVATERTVRREKLLRSIRRAFTLPFVTMVRNRSLIRTMVRRDVLGRYRGSFGGAFWTMLNPLILMLTYFFVFGVVLRTRAPNDPSRSGFALYFLAGMLPWLAVSEAAGRAPTVMLEYRNFVKKLVFPVETLPLNLVTAGLVSEVFGVALFLAGSYFAHGSVPASIVWLPVLIVPQILLTAGLCWFLAARACSCAICPSQRLPANTLVLPDADLLPGNIPARPRAADSREESDVRPGTRLSRHATRRPRARFPVVLKLCVVAVVVFILGHEWFYKLRKSFADIWMRPSITDGRPDARHQEFGSRVKGPSTSRRLSIAQS